MPQFNWTVLGPVVLAVAGLVAAASFALSIIAPHPQHGAPLAVTHAAAQATETGAATRLATPIKGVRLSGRVVGTPHLRGAPSSTAETVRDLQSGESVAVSGCSPGCGWYLVTPNGASAPGWVSAAFINVQGDDRSLPVIK